MCPLGAFQVLMNRITEITEHEPTEFSIFEIAAVEEHPQNDFNKDSLPYILVGATRDFLNALLQKDVEIAINVLEEMMKMKHPIFQRISLCIIGVNWKACSSLSRHVLREKTLNDPIIKHEVYTLLRNNFSIFTHEQQEQIVYWIESGPHRDENEEYNEKASAFWRQQWLSALVTAGYRKATELYQKYLSITGIDPDNPDFSSWMEVSSEMDLSPISINDLLEKSNSEIAEYLISYKDDEKHWKGPSRVGLEIALYEAVKSRPAKFDSNLIAFTSVTPNYLYEIIRGLNNAWEENADINWGNVLEYCKTSILPSDLWYPSRQGKRYNYKVDIIREISNLIIRGTKDDGRAFDPKYLPLAEDILLSMLTNTEPLLEYSNNLFSDVINSSRGRVLDALIVYSLRVARLKDTENIIRWSKKVKEEFTRRLDRSIESDLCFSLILGRYLPNLNYLDSDWVETNLNLIFLDELESHWLSAMEGYLLGAKVSSRIYDLVSGSGQYKKAIGTEFKNKATNNRLMQHLCLGYMLGKENIIDSSSPLGTCIARWNIENIDAMISFFWSQREFLNGGGESEGQSNDGSLDLVKKAKILDFWRLIYEMLNAKDEYSVGEKTILSNLIRLSCYIDTLDSETEKWLLFSARFIDNNHNSPYLIENLLRFCDDNANSVGNIYVEMLSSATPTYDKKHISSIVAKLYEYGENSLADRIRNIYGSRGEEFLRDIYNTNNRITDNTSG
jgi:hypothetical protein